MKKKKTTALQKTTGRVKAITLAKRPAPTLPEQIETLLMQGDLTALTVPQRLVFYKDLCRSLGLNYRTRPFEYIVFTDREQDEDTVQQGAPRGKMVLYARADCAAQLRKIYHVGIDKNMRKRREGEFYIVEADAFVHEKLGTRTDTSTGVVWLKKYKRGGPPADLAGRELANAMMKAETKAKRRVTFSICGLHMLDESELEDLTAMTYDVTETGRVIEVLPPPEPKMQDNKAVNDLAFYIAAADRSEGSMGDKLRKHTADLQKLSPEQVEALLQRYRVSHHDGGAKEEGAAAPTGATPPGTPAVAPSEIDPHKHAGSSVADPLGVTLREMKGGWWRIEGSPELLRPVREEIKKLCNKAKLPDLMCDSQGCGKMIGALERAKIPHRMASDGDGA